MRRILTLNGLLALGLLAGCQVDSNGTGEDAGGGSGGGSGGSGGNADPDSGAGGGGVDPNIACSRLSVSDCPERADCVADGEACVNAEGADCVLLREAQCDARADCAPRADAFGAFADCKILADVACALLDEDRCGEREDCAWDPAASTCSVPSVSCEQRADEADCEANACYWWGESCQAGPEPAHCDQPDEATCLAAECEWTRDGCREPVAPPMDCGELGEVACSARMDCTWAGDRCEVNAEALPCEQLAPEPCALRNDCAFDPSTGACGVRAQGACDQLDEFACVARPDCVADYQQPVDCVEPDPGAGGANGGGAPDEAPAPPPCPPDDPACAGDPPQGCAPVFIGCRLPGADCAAVPPEQCADVAGCHLEEGCAPCPPGQVCPEICQLVMLCAPDAGPRCDALTPDQCLATPGCHLEDNAGGCDCFIDADGREVCACVDGGEPLCVADQPAPCEQLFDANSCFANPSCIWEGDPACNGGGAPVPCDCPPDDPNCACAAIAIPVECGRCVTAQPWDPCAGLPPDLCLQIDGCQLEAAPCDCGFDPAGNPIDCDCVGEAICVQAPPPCQLGDEASCNADPGCEWIGFGMEPPPCDCAPDDPNCACPGGGGMPFPGDGFCQQRWVDPCGATPIDLCDATPGCGIQELQPPCLPCDPDMPECPVCEPIPVCVPLEQICGGFDSVACASDPRCEVYANEVCMGGGEVCPPGVDCPPPLPPVCEVQEYCGPARNRCVNIPGDQCAMMASCVALSLPDGSFDVCWDANLCDGLNHDQCESHPSCRNEIFEGPCGCFIDENGREVCECAPGGEYCTSEFMDPPPPPGNECRADADCPDGGFCDAMFGVCVFPL